MNEIPSYNHLQYAREYATTEYYKGAFEHYIKAMETYPRVRKLIEFEFRVVLVKLNEYLTVVENNKGQILLNFQSAMKVYPGNVNLLSDIGKYLYQFSYFFEAIVHFERALQIDASLVSIEKSLDSAKKIIFSRAHFRLLNDKRRNKAYAEALRAIMSPNENVLDADTGTGLSALFANAYSALSTTACDPSMSMIYLAQRIMTENNVQEILLINKPASKLHLSDVYGERTMLITNKFDPGLFGDQLLQTLKNAWDNLMSDIGRVVPGRAEYHVVGAKCDRVLLKYQLGPNAKKLLKVHDLNIHTETVTNESYYGEDVTLYDDIEYVTDSQKLLDINFNDYYDINRKLKSTDISNACIKALKDTEVNVVIGWFKLYLSENVVLTTDPQALDRSEAWQPAVFIDFIPKHVKEDEEISVQMQTFGGKLKYLPESKEITTLSATAIAFLNDSEYMMAIEASVRTASIYLGQITDVSDLEIADLCPFPLFGMLMMKRGARSLMCFARHAVDKAFMELVFKRNNIPMDNVTILVADYWNHGIYKERMYHAIFCNALDLNGDIEVRLSRITQHLQYAHLVKGGLMLPTHIKVMCQLISCDWLDKQNRMSDDVTPSFRLASQVNLFQVSQANCIDPSRLVYEPLSEPTVLSECSIKMKSEVSSVPIIRDGVCNAVLCWYEIQLLERDEWVSTKRSNSFVDSSAFLPNPRVTVFKGDSVSVIRCVDCDGAYKVVIDLDVL